MYELVRKPLSRERLWALLQSVDGARVGLIGDLCLDMYWEADMRLSELSRETPHFPLPIYAERYSPGGAGNAASNIASLRPGRLRVLGVVGEDWRGDLLRKAFLERGIDDGGLVRAPGLVTNTYIKPLRHGISGVVYEDPRLDFENRAPLDEENEAKLLAALERVAREVDVLCVSDQLRFGCVTPRVRERICRMGAEGLTVIVDSRDRAALYHHVTVKPNEVEASRAFGSGEALELSALAELARAIRQTNDRLTLVTLGEHGCFVADGERVVRCPACPVEPPIDFVGAGDTFLAGFGTLLAAGAAPIEAAQVATLASAVTIKKIGTTGTASREEVLAAWELYYGKAREEA